MINYEFTSIEFANWPEETMFGVGADNMIKTKLHLYYQSTVKNVSVNVTVGNICEE